ncbi:MAG: hypothetical protein RLZ47_94, partial [Bacteroidota bacterium]
FDVLGLQSEEKSEGDLTAIMDLLIRLRNEAKAKQDYATSDQIRMSLQDLGIQLKDGKSGTTWDKI